MMFDYQRPIRTAYRSRAYGQPLLTEAEAQSLNSNEFSTVKRISISLPFLALDAVAHAIEAKMVAANQAAEDQIAIG